MKASRRIRRSGLMGHRARGYTIVELLMAMTVFAIGVTGIAAMQKITLASNLHAKKLATATHIAQSWQERLTADAALWPSTAVTLTGTQWLANAAAEAEWKRAPTNAASTFGGMFGPLGEFTVKPAEAYFCVDIRLTPLSSTGANPIQGNGLMRSEVRVFWPRDGREPSTESRYCDASNAIGAGSDEDFHVVYDVAAVRQTQ